MFVWEGGGGVVRIEMFALRVQNILSRHNYNQNVEKEKNGLFELMND